MAYAAGTDANLLKEEARIESKRRENAERRDRFLNARTRVMGIDVNALDQQVREKSEYEEKLRRDADNDRLRSLEIDRVVEEAKQEEEGMKRYLNAEVKRDWEAAIAHKQDLAKIKEPFLDPLKAGVSAAQNFAGADPHRKDRIKAQQEQMRSWVFEQVAEKESLKKMADDHEASYSTMLQAVGEIRDAADNEEKEMAKYLNDTVRDENKVLAEAHTKQKHEHETWLKEMAATSIDLRDNEDLAMDENGRIVRTDQFRGYTKAQVRRVVEENEAFMLHKREINALQDGNDEEWRRQQLIQQQAMEMASHNEQSLRKEELMANLQVIKAQMAAQRQRTEFGKKDRFGAVEPGFFDKFGMGCR